MKKPDNYYNDEPLRRTLEELQEFASESKGENYCCVHQPLLNIPLDHIILDELHLMLRHYRRLDWQLSGRCHAVG